MPKVCRSCACTPPCQLCVGVSNGCTSSNGLPGVPIVITANQVVSLAGAPGSGYTTPPVVTLTGGLGTGGAALAVLGSGGTAGQVVGYTVTAPGAYQGTPTAALSGGGGGSGATAAVTMDPDVTIATGATVGMVVSVTVPGGLGGSGYTSAPAVAFSGGGGAAGTAVLGTGLSAGKVIAVTVTAGGSYPSGTTPAVAFSGGGGSGATATAVMAYKFCTGIATAGTYKAQGVDACLSTATAGISCPAGGAIGLTQTKSVSFQVTGCGGVTAPWPPGMTVALTGPGGYAPAPTSIAPTSTGLFSWCVPVAGSYTCTVVGGACYQGQSASVTVAGSCATTGPAIALVANTGTLLWSVGGCMGFGPTITPNGLAGATVTISAPGYSATRTSDGAGLCTFTGVPYLCTYTVTMTYPRFVTATGSVTMVCPGPMSAGMSFTAPAPGYVCTSCVQYPLPLTLNFGDANGSHSAPFSANGFWPACYIAPEVEGACFQTSSGSGPCQTVGFDPVTGDPILITADALPAVAYTFDPGCGFTQAVSGCLYSNAHGLVTCQPINGVCVPLTVAGVFSNYGAYGGTNSASCNIPGSATLPITSSISTATLVSMSPTPPFAAVYSVVSCGGVAAGTVTVQE